MEQSTSETTYTGANPRSHAGSLICWRSVLAGTIVAVFAYMILAALGAGVAGFTAAETLENGGRIGGIFSGAGVWIGISGVVSVFLGAYAAARYSEVNERQVAAFQGILIAGIFFFFLAHGAGSFAGSLQRFTVGLSGGPLTTDAETAARAVGDAGWMLFATFLLGTVAAIFGGIEGALGNVRKPFRRVGDARRN